MPKKTPNAILSLEKKVAKTEQQLMTALSNKADKLTKVTNRLNVKQKQSKTLLSLLSKKTSARAKNQRLALKSKLIVLQSELNLTKTQLTQAKTALTKALILTKAVTITKKLLNKQNKQATLKKKKINKIIRKVMKIESLTPNLSKPVTKKNQKLKKIWRPATAKANSN